MKMQVSVHPKGNNGSQSMLSYGSDESIFFIISVYVCVSVCMCWCLQRPEKGLRVPGVGVAGACAGN